MNQKDKGVAVVIPSYKETKNLSILIPRIHRAVKNVAVIVVDDSPKPELTLLRKLQKRLNSASFDLIYRGRKLGRGSAVLAGIKKSLTDTQAHYIMEMDADLAHKPEECSRLIQEATKSGAGMIVGSRYTKGSEITDWPKYRLVQSKIINFFLRYWLGLSISDYTNGFRLYTREAAEYLVHCKLHESGFIALSEIAYALKRRGFRIREVPISFTDRKFGTSNANLTELFRSLVGAIRIRFRA